jgi:hypothetical protein
MWNQCLKNAGDRIESSNLISFDFFFSFDFLLALPSVFVSLLFGADCGFVDDPRNGFSPNNGMDQI